VPPIGVLDPTGLDWRTDKVLGARETVVRLRSVSWVTAVVAMAAALGTLGPVSETAAQVAGCEEIPSDYTDLMTWTPRPDADGVVRGPAPLTVTFTIRGGIVTVPSGLVTFVISWGDGGAVATIRSEPCGDGETEVWPQQNLYHTFTTPGTYELGFSISALDFSFGTAFGAVEVTAAVTPTPATTTPEPAATTPAPAAATAVPAPDPVTQVPAPAAVQSPSATPVPATATPTSSPAATAAAASPTVAAAAPTSEVTPVRTEAASANVSRPEVIRALRDIGEVSADPEVVGTNVLLAGATVWVLFTSVLLNQVLQENRSEVERQTQWLTAPVRGLRSQTSRLRRGGGGLRLGRFGWVAPAVVVLLVTGLIYSALEPGFGLNGTTVVLFFAVVAGVGLLTYISSGLEALATSRMTGATAAVRPYPATIAIAIVSVVVSRALNFQPGMVYGFVASCVVLTPMAAGDREKGRIALLVVLVGLVLTLGAWLAVAPIRAAEGDSGGWGTALAEAVAVMIFVGGIEGVFFSMIPVAGTGGEKIFRWNRVVWALIAVSAAFLFWHVLLGREQAYFSGVRETQSLSVIALFVVYTSLTIGAWAYFRFRHEPAVPV